MHNKKVAILVVSCDKYSDIWDIFFKSFFKYWPDCPYRLYLGTNQAAYADARVRTIAVGADRSYAENLRQMLQRIEEDWVICWVEDRVISGGVKNEAVARLIADAQAVNAAYLKLIPEHPLAYWNASDIGVVPAGTRYRVSMTVALWQKRNLLQLLKDGENAWQLEKIGSVRSAKQTEPFMALAPRLRRNPPIPHAHLIVKGRLTRAGINFLQDEGLLESLPRRPLEPWRGEIYALIYHLFFRLVRPMQAFVHCWKRKPQSA